MRGKPINRLRSFLVLGFIVLFNFPAHSAPFNSRWNLGSTNKNTATTITLVIPDSVAISNLSDDVDSVGIWIRTVGFVPDNTFPPDTVLAKSDLISGLEIRISHDSAGEPLAFNTSYYISTSARDTLGDWQPNFDEQIFSPTSTNNEPPQVGYTVLGTIPASQITQDPNTNLVTVNFKVATKIAAVLCTLFNFEYSLDGGSNWDTLPAGDQDSALSEGWTDSMGQGYSSVHFSQLFLPIVYSFQFNPKASSVGSIFVDSIYNNVQFRFRVKDTIDIGDTVVTESFTVDCKDFTVAKKGFSGKQGLPYSLGVFPNPFGNKVNIEIWNSLGKDARKSKIEFSIYNIHGELVFQSPVSPNLPAISWDGRDIKGNPLPNGLYFYKIISPPRNQSGRLVLRH